MSLSKILNEGVVDPKGFLLAGAAPIFLALIPVTNLLTTDNSIVGKLVDSFVSLIPGTSNIARDRMIPALSAFYIFWTFAGTGAISAAGQNAGTKGGRDNNAPRKALTNLTGLPLRLYSAHSNLMEMFPGFALAAALAQSTAPGNRQLINLLGLHVLLKSFVYWPSYVFDLGVLRSLAHLGATASVINVVWRIATRA